jgi:hypothetical protein
MSVKATRRDREAALSILYRLGMGMEEEHDAWLEGSPLPEQDWLKELDTLALMYAEGFAAGAAKGDNHAAVYALSEFFGVWLPTALAMTRCLHCGDPPSWHRVNTFCRKPDGGVNCPCRSYEADLRGQLRSIGR